jgi:hypothetical protein
MPLGNPVNACMVKLTQKCQGRCLIVSVSSRACSCCGGAGWLSTREALMGEICFQNLIFH